jgi:apolipoprotein D and lipocalin family protein
MHVHELRRTLVVAGAALALHFVPVNIARADADTTPVPRVASVDLTRYAGPWFIIGSIPLSLEKGAHNPVETYTPQADGTIKTVFEFRKDRFDGELEIKPTKAKVVEDTHNAEWKVTLIWPFKGQYVISHLEPDYSSAIIARDKRDHVWILSRTATLSDARMADYRARIVEMGYDLSKFELFAQNGSHPNPTSASSP